MPWRPILTAAPCIAAQDIKHSRLVLTDEAKSYVAAGSPEAQLFRAIDAEGTSMAELKVRA